MRLLIADDEQNIRDYIAGMFNWTEFGFTDVRTAANGAEALQILLGEGAELVITDVKMPVLDGIGFAERAREAYPQLPIIFLTAFHEFEYARQAVRLGIADFITKPFVPEDLVQSVRTLRSKLQQTDAWSEEGQFFALFGNEEIEREKKRQWLDNRGEPDGAFQLLFAEWDDHTRHSRESLTFTLMRLKHRFSEEAERFGLFGWMALSSNGIYGFVRVRAGAEAEESARLIAFARELVVYGGEQAEGTLSVGVSRILSSCYQLPEAIRQINKCMEYRMLLGRQSVVAFDALESVLDGKERESVDAMNQLADVIRTADQEGIQLMLKQAYRRMLSIGAGMNEIRHFVLQTLDKADTVLREFGMELDAQSFVVNREKMLAMTVLTDVMRELEVQLLFCAESVKQAVKQSPKRIIADVVQLINESYAVELTLQEAANRLNINYSHLSRLIKKEIGRNFSDLLWERRIEAAKTILLSQDMKAYEVAYSVGFKDPGHFSLLFKKMTGHSPGSYKSNMLVGQAK